MLMLRPGKHGDSQKEDSVVKYKHPKEKKNLSRIFHLFAKFHERIGVTPLGSEFADILEQINTPNTNNWLKPGNQHWIGIYKVNFRDRDIIVVSDKKHIFTTYGWYKGNTLERKEDRDAIEKIDTKL